VCGSWFGIRCDYKDEVHVNDISLQNNALSGSVPSLIGLPYLEQFWIDTRFGNGNDNNIDLDLSVFE